MNTPRWNRLSLILLLSPGLLTAGCLSTDEAPETGASDSAASVEAEVDAEAAVETDVDAEAAVADGSQAEDAEPVADDPAQTGLGMQHRYMQDAMHDTMLSQAVELGIFSADDARFFAEAHAKMEPYQPAGADSAMGRAMDDAGHRAMQRAVTDQAVADGALSDAEADRFTALHDRLIENGLMVEDAMTPGAAAGPGMGQGMGQGMHHGLMQDAMHEAMLSQAVEQGLIEAADAELFTRVHAAMEPFQPEGAGPGSGMGRSLDAAGKKAMQRGILALAVADGAVSEEDAARFTEIHDLLLDEGLMPDME